MMFAQVNSEHCRHKIFRATWTIDNQNLDTSLFDMIRNTYNLNPSRIVSAYSDNAAVLTGPNSHVFRTGPATNWTYAVTDEQVHSLAKVETHNHPTAVSPFPGAATGSGGEIRDEGAVGQGSKPKSGLTGFTVSNLRIPGFIQPWETSESEALGKPAHVSSAFDIMIQAPLGGAAFNNEFGRPNICGYFRTFLEKVDTQDGPEWMGYHKPIMIAGGTGSVRPMHVFKKPIPSGSLLVVLGGPAMLIGLGGGAASSMAQGSSSAALDFASVQRDNAEIQRRAQMVLDACTSLGDENPLLSVHDVGAGGLSNALPELVHDCGRGARIDLKEVGCADPLLSPMEVWCNESQERYVLAIAEKDRAAFEEVCKRERCPFAVVGVATEEERLVVVDSRLGGVPAIDLDMGMLFGKPPRMHRVDETRTPK
ncbi:PurM, N-terminal-like protein, partial [Chytridium lagenaria]